MEFVHRCYRTECTSVDIVGYVPEFQFYFVLFIRIHGQQLDESDNFCIVISFLVK